MSRMNALASKPFYRVPRAICRCGLCSRTMRPRAETSWQQTRGKKATIFYLTFVGLQSIHESPRAWIPLGVCSHEQVSRIQGGLSKVHSLFFEDWHQQNLGQRFEVAPGVQVMLEIAAFCADMDAQRAALEAKGSAGLRPCAFCMNCVSAYSDCG